MILSDIAKVIRDDDIPSIIDASIAILEKTGVKIEHDGLLSKLAEHGAIITREEMRVRFPKQMTEDFLAASDKVSWHPIRPKVTAHAGIYQGYYLDRDNTHKEWTQERILEYAAVARALPNVGGVDMLGYPPAAFNDKRQPLLEKWFCWKYGIHGGNSIWMTELCPLIHEMWQIYADWQQKDAGSLFNGTVYLISPLHFAKEEAEQFIYFFDRGLRVHVGWMGTLGATVPVTIAGALALHFAEGFFVNMLNRIFFGDTRLWLHGSVSVMDMRTGSFQYGRPEQTVINMAGAQIAKYLGASYSGHCGLTDAKRPGYASAGQKVYSALANAMAYGSGGFAAGLLSVDEVFSPIQMILDDEMTGNVNRLFGDIPVTPDTLALSAIDEVSKNGTFLDHDHTASHFKNTLWFPELWSKESFNGWKRDGEKDEISRAMEKFEVLSRNTLEPVMPDDVERELLKVIENRSII